jgi:hypothetical protein
MRNFAALNQSSRRTTGYVQSSLCLKTNSGGVSKAPQRHPVTASESLNCKARA